ncbi:hypothetical protein BKA64DRAFT_584001 [Cadophora sp. MPI-SDFR-AT-0126]|nr:hypothetical protein BKA64DRAFT_584001 [Leotiomycetes sp. MPI-SDFR-AT-0126]
MTTASIGTFEAVLEDFKKSLNTKQIQNFQFSTLDDVRQTALEIQNEQDQTKSLMNMTRLESFLEAMDQFGKVIGVFVNASSFVAFVWGPIKFLLLTARTWTDSFETLLDAYGQLGDHIPLLQQYHSLFGSTSEMTAVLVMMYRDILSFHKEATKLFSGKVWRQLFRSMWKNFESTFKQILDNLKRHRDLIKEQATVISFQRQELFIEQYKRDVEDASRSLEKKQEEEQWKKYLDVREWFSASNSTEADHESCQKAKSPGTGVWILKNEKVRNWLQPDVPESSLLWVNGIPGAGKTILASIIIDASIKNGADSTAYFYCKENDAEKNTCISVYRGILSQLLNNHRELVPYYWDKMVSTGETVLTTTHLAEGLLKTILEKAESSRIIVDGLDECNADQRKLLLAFFTNIVGIRDEKEPGKLRVVFMSQDYNDIQKALQAATNFQLSEEENKADIETYVHEQTSMIQQKFDLETATARDIEETTCGRARGMFLFAKLVMEYLHGLDSKENLLEEIKFYGFPDGLEEAYERIIKRLRNTLSTSQWGSTRKLMGWMVCAKRPLRWREIQAAVSMDAEDQNFDFDKRKLRSSIQDYCGSLIQVLPGDRVELVHATAKMYITTSQYIVKSTVECELASICLRYLTFDLFAPDIEEERLKHSIRAGDLSLQDYAVAKWMEHVHSLIKNIPWIPERVENETSRTLNEVVFAVSEFALRYEKDILQCEMTNRADQDCEILRTIPCHEDLMNIWNLACQHASKGSAAKNDISIKELGASVTRNRELLEKMSIATRPQSTENEQLDNLYGDRRFKCPKVTCYYFHEGFKDAKIRDQHINRHDRPFSCSFPDCSIVEFGFSSNKDLERHRRFFHPETEDQANSFNTIAKTNTATPHECYICRKRFTRSFILKQHLLSHTGTRPHACSECGKAFTRANDCTRHEKIHARRR